MLTLSTEKFLGLWFYQILNIIRIQKKSQFLLGQVSENSTVTRPLWIQTVAFKERPCGGWPGRELVLTVNTCLLYNQTGKTRRVQTFPVLTPPLCSYTSHNYCQPNSWLYGQHWEHPLSVGKIQLFWILKGWLWPGHSYSDSEHTIFTHIKRYKC